MRVVYRERDNMPRWDRRRRGFYEVYYIKLNDPKRRLGLWLRFTFMSPAAESRAPEAALWGFFFHRDDPSRNFAIKQHFGLADSRFDPDIFFVQIGESAIYTMGTRGRLAGEGHILEWDLKFDTDGIASRILPASFYRLPWPPTKFLSPYFDTRISGLIQVDGEGCDLQHVKGHQGHLWGTTPAARWAWVHCNDFVGEEGVAVELLAAPVGGREKVLFHLRRHQRDIRASNLVFQKSVASRLETHAWVVDVPRGREKIIVRATRRPQDCHRASYAYPHGEERLVTNCTVADCELIFFHADRGNWIESARYRSDAAAAFETALSTS